jgi:hypothetical protein
MVVPVFKRKNQLRFEERFAGRRAASNPKRGDREGQGQDAWGDKESLDHLIHYDWFSGARIKMGKSGGIFSYNERVAKTSIQKIKKIGEA